MHFFKTHLAKATQKTYTRSIKLSVRGVIFRCFERKKKEKMKMLFILMYRLPDIIAFSYIYILIWMGQQQMTENTKFKCNYENGIGVNTYLPAVCALCSEAHFEQTSPFCHFDENHKDFF